MSEIFAIVFTIAVFCFAFYFKYGRRKNPPATPAAQPAPENSPPATTPAPAPSKPYGLDSDRLARAFASLEQTDKTGMSIRDIGLLEVTTGQVVACDPMVMPDRNAFTQTVPNGRHPVSIAIARNRGGDERIAYTRLRFSDAAPVRWEMALLEGQDSATLRGDEFFGYGVDAGTGCFMDRRAGQLLEARMQAEDDYYETIMEEMDKTYAHTRSWADLRPDPSAPENVICFSSGWGDGSYPSFFGFDAEGKVAMLVTDFLVTESAD